MNLDVCGAVVTDLCQSWRETNFGGQNVLARNGRFRLIVRLDNAELVGNEFQVTRSGNHVLDVSLKSTAPTEVGLVEPIDPLDLTGSEPEDPPGFARHEPIDLPPFADRHYFFDAVLTWQEARHRAELMGGQLVCVESQEE